MGLCHPPPFYSMVTGADLFPRLGKEWNSYKEPYLRPQLRSLFLPLLTQFSNLVSDSWVTCTKSIIQGWRSVRDTFLHSQLGHFSPQDQVNFKKTYCHKINYVQPSSFLKQNITCSRQYHQERKNHKTKHTSKNGKTHSLRINMATWLCKE